MTSVPTPYQLWRQAGGDAERYVELMHEHGHIVDRKPGDDGPVLSCGWPERRGGKDPLGVLTDEQYDELHDELAEMANKRRRAEAEAGQVTMS